MPNNGYFWTVDKGGEKLIKDYGPRWRLEQIMGYVFQKQAPNTIPVYRFLRENAQFGNVIHFWTLDSSGELLAKPPWKLEAPAFFVYQSEQTNTALVHRYTYKNEDLETCHYWTEDSNDQFLKTVNGSEEGGWYILKDPLEDTVPLQRWVQTYWPYCGTAENKKCPNEARYWRKTKWERNEPEARQWLEMAFDQYAALGHTTGNIRKCYGNMVVKRILRPVVQNDDED